MPGFAETANTVPFRDDDLAILHDGDADTRNLEGLHHARDEFVQAGERRSLLCGSRRGQQGNHEQEQPCPEAKEMRKSHDALV
jgi:hypothetical protein